MDQKEIVTETLNFSSVSVMPWKKQKVVTTTTKISSSQDDFELIWDGIDPFFIGCPGGPNIKGLSKTVFTKEYANYKQYLENEDERMRVLFATLFMYSSRLSPTKKSGSPIK